MFALSVSLLPAKHALAAPAFVTITVTTGLDDDGSTCDSNACTLRGAMNKANTNGQPFDVIVFAPTASAATTLPGTSEARPGSAGRASIGEDIIALWSNAETPQTLTLALATAPTHFKQATLTRFADVGGPPSTTTGSSAPPAAITVQSLVEFYFLSVISDRPGFGWLSDLPIHTLFAQRPGCRWRNGTHHYCRDLHSRLSYSQIEQTSQMNSRGI